MKKSPTLSCFTKETHIEKYSQHELEKIIINNPRRISHIPKEYITLDLCLLAIKHHFMMINHLPDDVFRDEILDMWKNDKNSAEKYEMAIKFRTN